VAQRFLKQMDNYQLDWLLKDHPALALVTLIARRARWSKSKHNDIQLEPGEALIGDYETIGLTERKYRTAKTTLQTTGIATFRATNRGTVAKLTDTSVYDISVFTGDGPSDDLTDGPSDRQATTNIDRESLETLEEERETRAREAFPDARNEVEKKAYATLIGSAQLRLLTKEHFLTALQFGKPVDLVAAAEECALAADGENGGVRNAFTYWKGYCIREASMGAQQGVDIKKSAPPFSQPRGESWRVGADQVSGW